MSNALFPASYSTLDTTALALLVAEKYGLENVQCKLLVRGVGDTYLIESAADRFILRAYRSSHRSLPQIQAELELLVALQQALVPVSGPVADMSGNLIQALDAVEGKRYVVLFTYARGKIVQVLNEQQLRSLGKEMARFHNVSSAIQLTPGRWQFDLTTTLFEPLARVQPYFGEEQESYEWLLHAAKLAEQQLAKLNTSSFSSGYCHFDFLSKNFHFEGDAVTLFDFDFMGYGWLANDIMTFWQHLCVDVYFRRMTQEEADTAYAIFLSAYREHRAINEEELAAIPYLSLGFWIFYMGFHATHDQFYTLVQPAQLKLRTHLIRQLMEKYWDK
jgi:Ser/Thr protein kinase RdoA (MazF antagonist)